MTDTIATAEPTETTIKRFLCRHIHTSGHRCGSPALRGEPFCYYHHTTRRPAPRHRGVHPAQSVFEMPAIDDRAGVQFALAQILNRLTTGQLDPKRANPILYTLKLAIWNLHEPRPAARTASRSSSHTDSRHSSASSFSIHDLLSGRESSPKESIPDDPISAKTPSPAASAQTIPATWSKSSSSMKTSAPSPPSPRSPPRRPPPPQPAPQPRQRAARAHGSPRRLAAPPPEKPSTPPSPASSRKTASPPNPLTPTPQSQTPTPIPLCCHPAAQPGSPASGRCSLGWERRDLLLRSPATPKQQPTTSNQQPL